MKHYLITPFDYPKDYPYLKERYEIFDKYTYPSVMAQTDKDFEWILLTSGVWTSDIKDLDIPNTRSISADEWRMTLRRCIQTRLDNDDMLLPRYIELAKKNIKEGEVLDFKGYRLDTQNKKLYTDKSYHKTNLSPFLTILDDKPIHDLSWHTDFHKIKTSKVLNEFGWVQVIHPHSKTMSKKKCDTLGDYVADEKDIKWKELA